DRGDEDESLGVIGWHELRLYFASAFSSVTTRWIALREYQILVFDVSSTFTRTRSSFTSTTRPYSPPIVCTSSPFFILASLSVRPRSLPFCPRVMNSSITTPRTMNGVYEIQPGGSTVPGAGLVAVPGAVVCATICMKFKSSPAVQDP